MVSLDEAVIARLESGGHKFEILIDPEAAQAFRESGEIDWDDALATEGVWSDSAKGEHAGDEAVQEVFGTLELEAVCTAILERGDIQLTAAQRKELVERRHKQLVAHIAASAMNPQTGTPHPPQRIENALEEARFSVDPFLPVARQVKMAVDEIRPLIPLSFTTVKLAFKISGSNYGSVLSLVREDVLREEWLPNGDWAFTVEVPAGMKIDYIARVGKRAPDVVVKELD